MLTARFSGLIACPITPFAESGAVAELALAEQIERLATSGVDEICVLGTAGSSAYLTRAERARVVGTAVRAARGSGVPVSAGVSALTTREVLELARDAQAEGADGLLLGPLSYVPLRAPEIADQVETVAAVASIPVCLDNNPATTGFAYPVDLAAELSALDGVAAFKDTAETVRALGNRQHLFAELAEPGTGYGAAGTSLLVEAADPSLAWHTGLAGALPQEMAAFRRAAAAGDDEAVARWQAALRPLIEVLRWERPLSSIYALHDLCGARTAAPRRPLHPVTGASRERMAAAVETVRAAR